jgi:hypothetical protein
LREKCLPANRQARHGRGGAPLQPPPPNAKRRWRSENSCNAMQTFFRAFLPCRKKIGPAPPPHAARAPTSGTRRGASKSVAGAGWMFRRRGPTNGTAEAPFVGLPPRSDTRPRPHRCADRPGSRPRS